MCITKNKRTSDKPIRFLPLSSLSFADEKVFSLLKNMAPTEMKQTNKKNNLKYKKLST